MSKAEELANEYRNTMPAEVMKLWGADAAAELRRMAAENEVLRSERTAWRVTAENAEAAVKQARIDALEEAKQACLNECVGKSLDDEELDDSDMTYNTAIRDAAGAIGSLKGTP